MKHTSLLFVILTALSLTSSLVAKAKEEERTWEQKKQDQAWLKKQLKGMEKLDQIITSLMVVSATGHVISKNKILSNLTDYINPLPEKVKNYNSPILIALMASKLGITLRRMQLHNRYVGRNPLKLIPSMAYFMTVDMLSWVPVFK